MSKEYSTVNLYLPGSRAEGAEPSPRRGREFYGYRFVSFIEVYSGTIASMFYRRASLLRGMSGHPGGMVLPSLESDLGKALRQGPHTNGDSLF